MIGDPSIVRLAEQSAQAFSFGYHNGRTAGMIAMGALPSEMPADKPLMSWHEAYVRGYNTAYTLEVRHRHCSA